MIAGWQLANARSTAPRRQTTIRFPWPLEQQPSARLVRAMVRSTGWRGGLSFLGRVKATWAPGVLLLDFDGDDVIALPELRARLAVMNLHVHAQKGLEQHKTARGWHLVIHLREQLTLTEAIAAQAILGSDPYREGFNLARARSRPGRYWARRANLLFDGRLK